VQEGLLAAVIFVILPRYYNGGIVGQDQKG